MAELTRRVGLGMAARGSVSDAIEWAERARADGLESVWVHDSYFERDAVSFVSAMASHVEDVGLALGALNPFTRHPVALAMTVSAIDEMAPGRVILGLGTGLPLRLGQMGIPYTPDEGVRRVSEAIDTVRALWSGERLPPGKPGLPPLQPMFAPVHRVPIYIAAYRTAFMELSGQKADGYLARPAESILNLRRLLAKMRAAAVAAGRPADAVDVAGYMLSLVDVTRREALNRAKREPFVIYMMSVLSDDSLHRAGFESELRDRIAEAWRAEEYHQAGQLIPDELLDAFLLCGTVDEVAARAEDYRQAGMDLPVLQPIVQEEEQVEAVLQAAVDFGRVGGAGAAWAPSAGEGSRVALDEQRVSFPVRLARRAGAWFEISRPFSFTASTVPVAAGGALAAVNDAFTWPLFIGALFASVLLHIGTNVTNEIYDVRKGVDVITSPRASHALLKGRMSEREAFAIVLFAFLAAAGIGVWLIAERGWPVALFGVLGLVGGFGYTAPPLQYKYRALGLPLVFLLMGPVMVMGTYYVVTGMFDGRSIAVSVPVGLLVAAILHGNEWRDISEDARAGAVTFSVKAGRRIAHWGYVSMVLGAYMALAAAVAVKALPREALLAMLSLPLLVRAIRSSELGASGQQRAIAMIDLQTAQLHAAFGFLLAAGLTVAALVR